MSTRAKLISDIELRIYQGKPSDDIELSKTQVGHWIDTLRDRVVSDKINKDISRGLTINPLYIYSEKCLSLTKEANACIDPCLNERYYISITHDVLPLMKDMGIVRITDNYGRSITGTDQLLSEAFRNLPYYKTSKSRQTFYRENKNIFISNNSASSLAIYSYNVFYVRQVTDSSVLDSDEYPLEHSLIPELLDEVEKIARRQMELGVSDQENDGTDPYNNKN